MIDNRPILFLDIDGPLIPSRMYFTDNSKLKQKIYKKLLKLPADDQSNVSQFGNPNIPVIFDSVAVAIVNYVVRETNAWMVIHSSWTRSFSKKQMLIILKEQNINIKHLHKDWTTPKKLSSSRAHEIGWWLRDHPEVKDYAIVDDDPGVFKEFKELNSHLISISSHDGILYSHYYEMLKHLGYKPIV